MATKENMKKWEDANKKLAEAHKKREAERGTSKTTNPLMKDFKERMEKRETDKAKEETKQLKKEARKAGRKFSTEKDKSQYVAPNGKEYAGPGYGPKPERKAKEEGPKKAPKRRATGREEMIAQRYMDNEKRKKEGGSSVVGS
jgi:hypothetical protein